MAVALVLNHYQIDELKNAGKLIEKFFSSGFVAQSRPELSPYSFEFPFDWSKDPFLDRNWMFQLHGWRMLDAFFNRMREEDVIFIGEVMTDWFEFYSCNPSSTPWFWYDMSTGLRASKIAYLIRWCREAEVDVPLSESVLYGLVSLHVQHLTNTEELNYGNHGLFQLNGLMALIDALFATDYSFEGLDAASEFAVANMAVILQGQLGEEGVHTENAPDYHFFALTKIRQVLAAPWWQREELSDIHRLFHRAEKAQYWLVTPSLTCPPVGDSAETVKLKECEWLREWPHIEHNGSLAARLDGYGVVRSAPELPAKLSHYLFFQGSFHSSGHKHADCLSFIWQEANRYRLWDSGKYGYQKDEMRAYFQSNRAHNTLEVDNKDFSRSKRDAYGSAIQTVEQLDGGWFLAGRVDHKKLEVSHQRLLFYRPGIGVDVLDRVLNRRSSVRTYRFWWHLGESAELVFSGTQVDVLQGGALDVVCNVQSSQDSCGKLEAFNGESEPRLAGWISREYLKCQPSSCFSVEYCTSASEFSVVTSWRLANQQGVPAVFEANRAFVGAVGADLKNRLDSLLVYSTEPER